MNALIKQLQTNENPHRIFADMTPDEQACLKEVGSENCEVLNIQMIWISLVLPSAFTPTGIYRIKPDYQPEPDYDKYEVHRLDDKLVITYHTLKAYVDIPIHECPSLPGFRGFWCDETHPAFEIELEHIAETINSGHHVIARFER